MNKHILVIILLLTYASQALAGIAATEVHYFDFGYSNNKTPLEDKIGNLALSSSGQNVTITDYGTALFNNSSNAIASYLSTPIPVIAGDSYAVSLWFKAISQPEADISTGVLSSDTTNSPSSWSLELANISGNDGTDLILNYKKNASETIAVGLDGSAQSWHHLVIYSAPSNWRYSTEVFLDNQRVSESLNKDIKLKNMDFIAIGTDRTQASRFNGEIDNITIISMDYNNGTSDLQTITKELYLQGQNNAIPEPATIVILVLGFALMFTRKYHHKASM